MPKCAGVRVCMYERVKEKGSSHKCVQQKLKELSSITPWHNLTTYLMQTTNVILKAIATWFAKQVNNFLAIAIIIIILTGKCLLYIYTMAQEKTTTNARKLSLLPLLVASNATAV